MIDVTLLADAQMSIARVLDSCRPGNTRLLLLPGEYRESLTLIGKEVSIYGRGAATLSSDSPSVVECSLPFSLLDGLTVACGGEAGSSAVLVNGGSLSVSNCAISCKKGCGVKVLRGSPTLRAVTIADCHEAGVSVGGEHSAATLVDCTFKGNWVGVTVTAQAAPELRSCTFDGNRVGLEVMDEDTRGIVTGCSVLRSRMAGIRIFKQVCALGAFSARMW